MRAFIIAALIFMSHIGATYADQDLRPDGFKYFYNMRAWCLADAPADVKRMVQALQDEDRIEHDRLFRARDTKCYDTQAFGRAPLRLEFVQEFEQIQTIKGRCWSIIELKDKNGSLAVSWIDCPTSHTLPGQDA